MKFIQHSQKYLLHLKKAETATKELTHLPKGKYHYRFTIKNPGQQKSTLIIGILEANDKVNHVHEFSEMVLQHEVILHRVSENFNNPLKISFTLEQGTSLIIQLPVSPVLYTSIKEGDVSYIDSTKDLIASLKKNISGKVPQQDRPVEAISPVINTNYFFQGCLTTPEAEKQLDYVIHYKLFKPDGSRGFTKLKRAVYRKMLIGIYNKLAKNSIRKKYFAKLYRNYVNSNIISENIEKGS